ncbi:MAG: PAS domain-containing protein [Melioribacteraceae bacterium]|nr:PAS domain-containing protein [Melioribacteraceae bacterium]
MDTNYRAHLQQLEEELRNLQTEATKLKHLFDDTDIEDILITSIGTDYRYKLVNQKWRNYTGYDADSVLGKSLGEIWGTDAFENEIKPRFDRAIKGDRLSYNHQIKGKSGEQKYFSIHFMPFIKNGKIEEIIVFSFEIN